MLADPLTAGQGAHQLAIQPPWVLVIDVLDYAAFLQVSRSQTTCQSTVLFPEPLLIEQQLAVERVLQDGLQALIREGLELDRPLAGGFQPRSGVDLFQTQDA